MVTVNGYNVEREGDDSFIVGCFSLADPSNYEKWTLNRKGETLGYKGKIPVWAECDTFHADIEAPCSAVQALKQYLEKFDKRSSKQSKTS